MNTRVRIQAKLLNAEERNKLDDSDFALPKRRYPIHDTEHARDSLSRVREDGTPEQIAEVKRKVHQKYPSIKISSGHAMALGDAVPIQAVAATADLPKSIVWMPAGRHSISAGTVDGPAFVGDIICDEQASRVIQASFLELQSQGQRVWLDENHDDGAAVADIQGFRWDPTQGIIANLDWTPHGESVFRSGKYSSFSPAFEAEKQTGRVTGLLDGHAAGGLVNAPAFRSAMPALIAARLGRDQIPNPTKNTMKDTLIKLLAALKVQHAADASEADLIALYAKHTADAANSQSETVKALKDDLAKVQASADSTKSALDAAKTEAETAKATAKNAIQAAEAATTKITETAGVIAALKSRIEVTKTDVGDSLIAFHDLDPATLPNDKVNIFAREDRAKQRGRIFAKDMAEFIKGKTKVQAAKEIISLVHSKGPDFVKRFKVQAANSLGTLSGNLVAQAALAFLKYELPVLSKITTDFSMENAKFNQEIITRIISEPSVSDYSTATGYASTGATDTDVDVTINKHKYVQIQYNANELASTNRDLFAEQSTAGVYALAENMVLAIYALLTEGNYTNTPTTVTTAAGFTRAAGPITIGQDMFVNKVPRLGRTLILNAPYYGGLMSDTAIVSFEAFQFAEGITEYTLPRIAGFDIIQAADLPGNSINLVGAGFVKEAIVAATRLPNDYTIAQPNANYGTVSQVTDPDTGLSLLLTQYVNHDQGASNWRVALMYGVAVGDQNRLQLVIS